MTLPSFSASAFGARSIALVYATVRQLLSFALQICVIVDPPPTTRIRPSASATGAGRCRGM